MRNLTLLLFLTLSSYMVAQQEGLNWLTNLEEAKTQAKSEKKPILVYFTGSDWCSPCKLLKEDFFNSVEFAARADDMVLVMFDWPRRVDVISESQRAYNLKMMAVYNKERTFPKILALNSKGKELNEISGYSSSRDTRYHFTFLDKMFD